MGCDGSGSIGTKDQRLVVPTRRTISRSATIVIDRLQRRSSPRGTPTTAIALRNGCGKSESAPKHAEKHGSTIVLVCVFRRKGLPSSKPPEHLAQSASKYHSESHHSTMRC